MRARLSSILQRTGIDIPVSRIEEGIREAHLRKAVEAPIVVEAQRRLPHDSDFTDANELLAALWNLTIPECDPKLDRRMLEKGPIEKTLLRDMSRVIEDRFLKNGMPDPQAARPAMRAAVQEWLDAPQKELGGRTPRRAILDERRSLGNPQEEVGFDVGVGVFEPTADEQAARKLLDEGKAALLEGRAEQAR
ncbi:MAG: hypothetical protein HY748_03235 [Elusimicrobia bacterium]|nr:hypothetical protein [Elusimicrobiota bacterium]